MFFVELTNFACKTIYQPSVLGKMNLLGKIDPCELLIALPHIGLFGE
uniref:Uncharacterized protein n=1 Tax=Manihot esculenta TaxID=3983 RepID=A0A2C9W1L2_MANES